MLWSTAWAVSTVQFVAVATPTSTTSGSPTGATEDDDIPENDRVDASSSVTKSSSSFIVPEGWIKWAEEHEMASQQAERLDQTKHWTDALFDVHGHQIFQLGLFNADPHPGNVILIDDDYHNNHFDTNPQTKKRKNRLGLIDFGQCKQLSNDEQVRIAQFILAIANDGSDEEVASTFRNLGIQTQNDSTIFLADFARLMFGPLQPKHLSHDWHKKFHKSDRVLYFPNELSMVYRTSLLLRGLAMSLQFNESISDQWKSHAQRVLDRNCTTLEQQDRGEAEQLQQENSQTNQNVVAMTKTEASGNKRNNETSSTLIGRKYHTKTLQRRISANTNVAI